MPTIEIPDSPEFSGIKNAEAAAELIRLGLAEKARRQSAEAATAAVFIPLSAPVLEAMAVLAPRMGFELTEYMADVLRCHVWSWRNYLDAAGHALPRDFWETRP